MNIPLFKMHSDEDDVEAVSKVIRRATFWADGPEIKEFESCLSKMHEKHALVFNSGTSALHAYLAVLELKGREVIVPSFTFTSTANSVVLAGGKPVFAEVEPETYGLDFEDVKKKITKDTKAIIIVHYAGCIAKDTFRIKKLCEEKGVLLIEDAAEAMGAEKDEKLAGTIGHAGMLSFCQSKIVTTGEGGAIITDDKELLEKLKLLRSHGRLEDGKDYFNSTEQFDYLVLGFNYRLPTMCAALGISQYRKMDKMIAERRKLADQYNKAFSKHAGVTVPSVPEGQTHVYQLYTIALESEEKRDALQKHLLSKGVMSKVYFSPVHLTSYYKKNFVCEKGMLPRTEEYSKKVLSLPFYIDMTEEDRHQVIHAFDEFFQ